MAEELGTLKTKAMAKYMGVVSLTKPQAEEILVAVYPDAPMEEINRAVILCASYGLNPLMKHVFLIPFNKDKPNETWVTVMGIKAKRLLASRRGSYSYTDETPRMMTDNEQLRVFGSVQKDKLMVITKLKDPETGAEAPGYGSWPTSQAPYGMDKGNSQFNMAAIRSESQALDRLRPGEMPVGIEAMPEEVADDAIDAEYQVLPDEAEKTEEEAKIKDGLDYQAEHMEHWCKEHNCPYEEKHRGTAVWYAHKLPDGSWCNEIKKKAAAPAAEPEPEPELEPDETEKPKTIIDMDWLKESLDTLKGKKLESWTEAKVREYMKMTYDVEALTVLEAAALLDKGQAAHFVKRVQDTLDMA